MAALVFLGRAMEVDSTVVRRRRYPFNLFCGIAIRLLG